MALTNAYESKLNRLVQKSKILHEIQRALVGEVKYRHSDEVVFITEKDQVPLYYYPIYDGEKDRVCIDARTFTTIARDGSLKVNSQMDLDFQIELAKQELVWNRMNRRDSIFNAFNYSNQVFVHWLTNLIVNRTGASIIVRTQIMVVSAMFLIGQYYNDVTSESSARMHLRYIMNNYPVDFDTIDIVATKIDYHFPRDIDEYFEAIQKLELGPRFRELSAGVFYQLLGGAWFANVSAKQVVATAVEYPPAFAVLCYTALNGRLYKNTGIGKVVESRKRNNTHDSFIAAYRRLIEKNTDLEG